MIDPREAETRDAARGRMPQFLRTALAGKIGLLAHLRAVPLLFRGDIAGSVCAVLDTARCLWYVAGRACFR